MEIFTVDFFCFEKGQRNLSSTADLALEEQGNVVCKLFALFCFVLFVAAPILHVQVTYLTCPVPN